MKMSTMFTRLVKTFTLCSCMFLFTSCQSDLISMGDNEGSYKYCGSHLADTLHLVCEGIYNSMLKKSSTGELADADNKSPYWMSPLEEIQFPFRPKANAKALLPASFRRLKRGIYDECCRKSCTISEMATYCGRR